MSFARWFLKRFRSPSPRTARNGNRCILRLEQLEDRLAPASLTVNTLADADTAGTLRYAINAINTTSGGATINFAPGLTGTIVLNPTLGTLNITQGVTIVGPGPGVISISGNNAIEDFQIQSPSTEPVIISGLTITGGNHPTGGGVYVRPSAVVSFTNCDINGNTATTVDAGGVYVDNSSNVTMTDCQIDNNTVTGGVGYGGGALTVFGTLTLTNCDVSNNSATGGGAGGGAIYTYGTVSMTNCTVENNNNANGGTIIEAAFGSLSMIGTVVSGNTMKRNGGAVSVASFTVATLTNCTVANNQTQGSAAGINNSGTMTVTGSTISGNMAATSGGGIVNGGTGGILKLINSTVSNNTAKTGAGIYANGMTVTLINSTVAGNTASGSGGGIYQSFGTTTLNNTILAYNTAALGNDYYRPLVSLGTLNASYSLIQNGSSGSGVLINGTSAGNIFAQDPLLGALRNNGGPTQTMALQPTSPAATTGNIALAVDANGKPLTTDQRGTGFLRVVNGLVAMGAYEINLLPISPATLPTVFVGVTYSQALTASGGFGSYTFSETGTLPNNLTLSSSGVLSGTTNSPSGSTFPITVNVTDDGGDSGSQSYTLIVDNLLTITPSSPLPTATDNNAYSTQLTPGGGSGSGYSFSQSGLPSGLGISTLGLISGNPPTVASPTLYNFNITLTDSIGGSITLPYTLTVDPALAIGSTPSSIPYAAQNGPYSVVFSASGGSGSGYSWSIVSGSLPPGITLSNGQLTGAATVSSGSYPFTVQLTDSAGGTASKSYTINAEGQITVNPTTSSLPTGTVSDSYKQTISASGGSGSFTFAVSSGSLPPGLGLTAINSTSAALSGLPTASGPYSFTVLATDSLGGTGIQNYTLKINPAITLSPTTLPATGVGINFSQQITANGGSGSGYTFSTTSNLDGLNLSPTGLLSGRPAANGTFPITVTATDGNGGTGSQAYTLSVSALQQTIGVFDPNTGNWYLRNSNSSGAPSIAPFGYGAPGWYPIVGNWNGAGVTTIGVVDLSTETWYLRNSNSPGAPDFTPFQYGAPGWIPVAGDWNHSGHTAIGVFDPVHAVWYLRNEVGAGAPDAGVIQYGGGGWKPVVGDWTGQGKTTIGVVDPSTATWYLRNENSPGAPDFAPFAFGGTGWVPVAGDWSGTGHSGIGTFDPSNGEWYLRNQVGNSGPGTVFFQYGGSNWVPIAGDWDFPALPQLAAGGEAQVPLATTPLTNGQLQSEVQAALNLLASDGVNSALRARLGSLQFTVGQLPAGYLGLSDLATGQVEISTDAAGYGWFVDGNPADSVLTNRMDLLTVVLHEMGHFNGWAELDSATNPDALMALTLGTGQRRIQDIDAVFAAS